MQSEETFRVIKPGILTTFQDMGRIGYQRFGVPASGAMDTFALQVANILVGNPRDTACMEVTLIGPELEVCSSTQVTVAITGANLEPKRNHNPAPMWTSFQMKKGDRLSFGKHYSGVRAYIAVAGGYDVPTIFGSKSTDVQSGFGMQLDDSAKIKALSKEARHSGLSKPDSPHRVGLHKKDVPSYEKSIEVAVVEGPHTASFTQVGREHFFNTVHTVDANSNRMGYRLKSPHKISLKNGVKIWSDAVPFGGIQVPPNGQPIILMADRQTTGGYPRIGTVISSDLSKVAQLVPQGEIKFYPISVEEAQKQAIQREIFLHKLAVFRKGIL